MPRPCPFVSCRYHLALELVDNGRTEPPSIRGAFGLDLDAPELDLAALPETCALDIADKTRDVIFAGGELASYAMLARRSGITKEHIKAAETSAMDQLREGGALSLLVASPMNDGAFIDSPDFFNMGGDSGYEPTGHL